MQLRTLGPKGVDLVGGHIDWKKKRVSARLGPKGGETSVSEAGP